MTANFLRFPVLSLLLLTLSLPVLARNVYVSEPTGKGIKEDSKATVQELIKMSVIQEEGYSSVDSAETAEIILNSQLLKLGDSYVLGLTKQSKEGQNLFSQRMKVATMSDIDTVVARLVPAVLNQKSVESTADVTNITEAEETLNTRRYQATRQWIIGFGPGWSSNLKSEGGGFTFSIGYLWGLDPDFGVNLTWLIHNGQGDDDSSYTDFSLGGEYYFSRSKHSPFIGGRVGYATARADDSCWVSIFSDCIENKASGWGVNATAGMKFFRTSTVNMGLFASYHTMFNRTSQGTPSVGTVQLAVYY